MGKEDLSLNVAWENGYIESFNARLRDELLNGEFFYALREAQIIIERRRRHYNPSGPMRLSATNHQHRRPSRLHPPRGRLRHADAIAGSKLTLHVAHSMKAGQSRSTTHSA